MLFYKAGCVAAFAERTRNPGKYSHSTPSHHFQPVAIESSGAVGPATCNFLKVLGRRVSLATGEPQATDYLFQRLSVAVQRRIHIDLDRDIGT